MVKGDVAKQIHGKNAVMDKKVLNFFRFVRTYDKKAADVLSANIGGPCDRWLRKFDALDR